jgi:outer membrane protein W
VLHAVLLLLSLSCAFSTFAGPRFEFGARYVTTVIREDTTFAGGMLDVPSSLGFAATADVFWTPNVSTQLSSTFVQPEAILFPASGGDIDLGTIGINVTNVMLRLHTRTNARLSPFAAAGVALVTFGNLDDRFGTAIEADVRRTHTFAVETGARLRVSRSVWLEALLSYVPVEPEVEMHPSLPDTLHLNPFIFAVGISRRLR